MAVLSLTWKSPYVDKTVFILRRGPVYWLKNVIYVVTSPTPTPNFDNFYSTRHMI